MNKIVIHQSGKMIILDISNIIYCSSDRNYSIVYLKDNSQLSCTKCLTKLTKDLINNDFIRISQSCVVNIDYIVEIVSQEKQILLSTNQHLIFTKKYKEICFELYKRFSRQSTDVLWEISAQ